jgi:hypothetical protein
VLYKILDKLFLNIVGKDKTHDNVGFKNFFIGTKYTTTLTTKITSPISSVFYTENNPNTSFLSKALSCTNYSLTLVDKFNLNNYYTNTLPVYKQNTIVSVLISSNLQNKTTRLFNSLTSSESFYNNSLGGLNTRINTTLLTLNYLNKFFKETQHSINFNFNLKENLNISNQQR